MDNYITQNSTCQDTRDSLTEELATRFTPKRKASEVLALSYLRIGYGNKSDRVLNCGTLLEFQRAENENEWKLSSANFCRDRLCPMCSWRRTYKIYAQISQIMNVIENDYAFLFLTLTIPNCSADELPQTIDKLQAGWHKLIHYKRFQTSVKGYFKALEVTRNTNRRSKSYNTYHPHFHVILAVKPSYFKNQDYIKQAEWLSMWRKAMQDDSITQVDIRRCKGKQDGLEGAEAVKALGSAVAEVAKYSVKSSDYLGRMDKNGFLVAPFPKEEIDEAVLYLGAALHRRRLTALGGIFEETAKQLQLDDCEDGDLVHVDGSAVRSDVAYMIRRYGWSCGAYKLLEERREVNIDISADDEIES